MPASIRLVEQIPEWKRDVYKRVRSHQEKKQRRKSLRPWVWIALASLVIAGAALADASGAFGIETTATSAPSVAFEPRAEGAPLPSSVDTRGLWKVWGGLAILVLVLVLLDEWINYMQETDRMAKPDDYGAVLPKRGWE